MEIKVKDKHQFEQYCNDRDITLIFVRDELDGSLYSCNIDAQDLVYIKIKFQCHPE